MFIQTETTPNPATLKFLPGRAVLKSGTRDFRDAAEAASASPLAARLFDIDGVAGVFLGSDFVSVTKGEGEWQHLKPAVLGAIMEHYLADEPMLFAGNGPGDGADEDFDPEDAELVATIKELIETRVRPAVANDGGDIIFRGYRAGTVYLKMQGACSGCPSSTATLRHGIENLLKHFVPEVEGVQPV
jgi:Fe-S cluster biogenesis protein NfuA